MSGSYLLERYGMTEIGMALSNPYTVGRKQGVGLGAGLGLGAGAAGAWGGRGVGRPRAPRGSWSVVAPISRLEHVTTPALCHIKHVPCVRVCVCVCVC